MPVASRDARPVGRSVAPGRTRGAALVLRKRGLLAGLAAALLGMSAGSPQIVAAFGSTRTISLHHIHTKENLTVTYKKDGKYIPEALKQINWHLRDWRENEAIEMDPKTIDLLWEMHTELGSKVPIEIICGYRSEKTNNMLRRTVGGQAKQSYHITGKAIDAVFPDVSLKQMRYSALVREVGGVGYYPTSGTPFVHVDSGPVRAWPRLPRYELALLFPNAKTQHSPAGGSSISKEDVRIAQARHKELATEVAAYFDLRNAPKAPVQVADSAAWPQVVVPAPQLAKPARVRVAARASLASATEWMPQLTSPPQQRRAPRASPPSEAERGRLNELVTLASPPPETERGRLNELVTLASLKSPEPPYLRPPAAERAMLDQLITASAGAIAPAPRATEPGVPPSAGAEAGQTPAPAQPAAQDPILVAALAPEIAPASAQTALPVARDAGWSDGWAPAPEFDEDHPEELSYRPFPIAPLLTESASADDAALVKVVHPDIARTLDLLDDGEVILPLRLRPGGQVAEGMSAQQFRGDAVDVSVIEEGERSRPPPAGLTARAVKTTSR